MEDICCELQIRPNWLMFVMYFESRLNHRAVNRISGATGLIQFMPSTARGLGTTTDALFNMSNVDQLYYVKKVPDAVSWQDEAMGGCVPCGVLPGCVGQS